MSTCGWITNSFSWEAPFYLIGSLSCIWFLLWIFIVYNNPQEHPRISKVPSDENSMEFHLTVLLKEELTYLEATIKQEDSKLSVAPYWEILKTKGFWALQFTWLGALWGNFTLWTLIPLYLNNIQHFPLNAVSQQFNILMCLNVTQILL